MELSSVCENISHLVLDVRGTILHPTEDLQASPTLLSQMAKCRQNGIHIGLVSGCSRKTIEELILRPLQCLSHSYLSDKLGSLSVYTETGSQGYFVDPTFALVPLPDYYNQGFSCSEAHSILHILKEQSEIHRIHGKAEMRSSQINFYCVENRQLRLNLAESINSCLQQVGLHNVVAHVPTSKTVIDISLGRKIIAGKDMINRTNLLDHDKAFLISDSFQQNGSDSEILSLMPKANAIHVGVLDAPLCKGVTHLGGPKATEMILLQISTIFA